MLLSCVLFISSCSQSDSQDEDDQTTQVNSRSASEHLIENKSDSSIECYLQVLTDYNPNSIDISAQLNKEILQCKKNPTGNEEYCEEFDGKVELSILKLYLYQLRQANQGYDLNSMRHGQFGEVLAEFLSTHNFPLEEGRITGNDIYRSLELSESRDGVHLLYEDSINIELNRIDIMLNDEIRR